jgi:hypothetical protein
MKAKDAARIFDNLPDAVLVPVAHDMKSGLCWRRCWPA